MNYLEALKIKSIKRKMVKMYLILKITKIVLVHCNIAKNEDQHDSRILSPFIPNKSLGQLLYILPKTFISLNNLTDQNSKALETEGKINIILVIN